MEYFKGRVALKCVYRSWSLILNMWKSSIGSFLVMYTPGSERFTGPALRSYTYWTHDGQGKNQYSITSNINFSSHAFFSLYTCWHLHYPQCNWKPLSDINGGYLSVYMQLPMELFFFFNILTLSSTPQDLIIQLPSKAVKQVSQVKDN